MKRLVLGTLIVVFYILNGCEDDPGSVGLGILDESDFTDVFLLNSNESNLEINSNTYIDSLDYGLSSKTLIGKSNNLSSSGVIKFIFSVPDSIKIAVESNELVVVNAWIEMKPSYSFGETNSPYMFTVHEIKNMWSDAKFNRDTLASIDYADLDLSSNHSLTDSLIIFNIDKDISYSWLKSQSPDSELNNYGIIFIPTPETERILGFQALLANNTANLPSLKLVLEKPNEFIDTISASPQYDAFAVTGLLPEESEGISFVQGGLPVRTNFRFDLTSIPETAIILSAEMLLSIDSLQTQFGSKSSDSLVVGLLADNITNNFDEDVFQIIMRKTDNKYKGEIRTLIQHLVDDKENFGMKVILSDETRAVSKVAIFNEDASDPSLKPLLKIIYADIK